MLVKIQFKARRHRYFRGSSDLELKIGDFVIVEADRGVDLGKVIKFVTDVRSNRHKRPLKKIIRLATSSELEKYEESNIIEREAFGICKKFIRLHELKMKLVDVECQFDMKKITFYFTAPRRVDFRALVRDLAGVFRIRIDMRQIGVRDEARRIGGYGPCGYPQCCTTFLSEFRPVNLKIAKKQNLAINPGKISGACGRLMCCLLYEEEFYEETAAQFPDIDEKVTLTDGRKGVITDSNPFEDRIEISLNDGSLLFYNLRKYKKNVKIDKTRKESNNPE
jgi:cell fate regulator YaaT (PSP1 superfamily)